MTIRIYGLKNCDTCRKAEKELRNNGLDVKFTDVRADGIDAETRSKFYSEFNKELINTRSTTWRNLAQEEREEDDLTLLSRHPALMKRPVIEVDGALYLGWKKDVQAALLG